YSTSTTGTPAPYFSGASYSAIRQAVAGIARVAPKLSADSVTMSGAAGATTVVREVATAEYLPILAGAPALGRFFSADEADVAAPVPRAVLSYTFWQRSFGGDSSVLSQEVVLGPTSYTIVGITPRGFAGIDLVPVDLWVT